MSGARAALLAVCTLLASWACGTGLAQHGYGGERIARGGWYTSEQAQRGEAAYGEHCARCHGVEGDGIVAHAPPLVGSRFMRRWEGSSFRQLFEYTRRTMPQDVPGTLRDDTYLAILAHLLERNGFAAGDTALRPHAGRLGSPAGDTE